MPVKIRAKETYAFTDVFNILTCGKDRKSGKSVKSERRTGIKGFKRSLWISIT